MCVCVYLYFSLSLYIYIYGDTHIRCLMMIKYFILQNLYFQHTLLYFSMNVMQYLSLIPIHRTSFNEKFHYHWVKNDVKLRTNWFLLYSLLKKVGGYQCRISITEFQGFWFDPDPNSAIQSSYLIFSQSSTSIYLWVCEYIWVVCVEYVWESERQKDLETDRQTDNICL